jgi:hypothetical protein
MVAALEAFDRTGLRAAVLCLRDIDGFARGALGQSLALESVEARLVRFLQGLSGRSLRVAAAGTAWTDTETVYLPPAVEAPDRTAGTERYKAMAALLWAQARHGTFKIDLAAALAAFSERSIALAWLTQLEALRLTARLGRDLPGMRCELDALLQGLPPVLDSARGARRPRGRVADSLAWLRAGRSCWPLRRALCPGSANCVRKKRSALRGARIRQQAEVLRLSVADLVSRAAGRSAVT